MHTAQRQAIRHHISAIMGMPPDVRGLESEQAVAEADVVLANGATFVVCLKDTLAEPGIPRRVLPDLPASSGHGFVESVGASTDLSPNHRRWNMTQQDMYPELKEDRETLIGRVYALRQIKCYPSSEDP